MAAEDLAIRIRAVGAQAASGAISRLRTSISGFGADAEDAGDQADRGMGRAKLAILGLGTAIAGLGMKGLSDALDIEQATSKMSAQLGMTAEQGGRLGKLGGELYANAYGEGISDVNDAIVALGQNTGDLGDATDAEIKKQTASVLNLGAAFDAGSQEVTRTIGALMKNGMAGSFDEAFDVITRGFSRGADKGGEFLDTMNEYAEPMKSLGFDAKTMMGLLVQGADRGIYSVDKIGDAFKEFGIRAVDGSEASNEAYAIIGLGADEYAKKIATGGPAAKKATAEILDALGKVSDPVKREAAGVGLFGSMWEDLGGQAILGLNPATAAMERTEGAADKLDKTLGSTSKTSLSAFSRQLQMGLAGVAEQYVLPALKDVIAMVQTAGGPLAVVGSLLASAGVSGRTVATVLIALAGVLAAVKVASLAYGAASSRVAAAQLWWRTQTIGLRVQLALLRLQMLGAATAGMAWRGVLLVAAGAARGYAAAQWLINAAMNANPVAKVITLLVLLGVGLVALWKKSETFRRIVTGVWNGVKGAAGGAVDWIRRKIDGLVGFLKGVPGAIGWALKTVADVFTAPYRMAFKGIASLWNSTVGKLSFKAPGWVPIIGGKGFDVPDIDVSGLATGGTVLSGGLTWVGERGPELLSLPAGAQVLNHRDSMRAASVAPGSIGGVPGAARAAGPAAQSSGGGDVYVFIDGDQIATRVERRMRRQKNITGRPAFR